MRIKFLMTAFGLLASSLAFNVQAQDMMAMEQEIRAECAEEAKNADNPEIYIEECVADKMQSIRDSQGSGDVPPGEG